MIPEVPAWVGIVLGALAGGGVLSAILIFIATRKRDTQSGIAERFDDASELTKYVDARIEAAVAPLREKLAKVEQESGEIKGAFARWVSAVWIWNQRGRPTELPMPPSEILTRLDLGHFADEWPTEETRRAQRPTT